MPMPNLYPQAALLLPVDWRDGAGLVVFRMGSTDVTMPSWDLTEGEGEPWEMLMALHGGTRQPVGTNPALGARDLVDELNVLWAAAGGIGVFTGGIDENDRVWLENDTEDIKTTGGAAFGFTPAGQDFLGGGGPWRQVADDEWPRGLVVDAQITVIGGTSAASVTLPVAGYAAQDVPTLLRPFGIGDQEDLGGASATAPNGVSLEGWLNDAIDPVGRRISAVVTDEGRVRIYWPTALGLTFSVATNAWPEFLDSLGYRGDEATAVDGNCTYLEFAHPFPSGLFPSRPIKMVPRRRKVTHTTRRLGGGASSAHLGNYRGYEITAQIDGIAVDGGPSIVSRTAEDLEHHFAEYWDEIAVNGDRVTVIRGWGDSRLSTERRNVRLFGAAADQRPLYSTLWNGEKWRGKYRCEFDADNPLERTMEWADDVAAWSELSLLVTEAGPDD